MRTMSVKNRKVLYVFFDPEIPRLQTEIAKIRAFLGPRGWPVGETRERLRKLQIELEERLDRYRG